MFKKKFPSLSSLGADGNTAFLRAARAGNLEKVLEYLKSNIDINTSNANGLNALHLASKDGHVNVVTELLKRGATVDAATKKGNTALHIASLAGQEEVVKILVQNGASVNVQSQNGFTPLYMAAQENHDNVVRFLLANGANQSLATEDGFTPLAVAMQQGHDKVVTVLLENDTRGKVRLPALHIAAKKDDCKAAALLLQNDHNPDVTSKSGFTPLHIAAHYGNENIANLLLQRGADVNYSAKHNITPLHVAAKWGKTNMVSLLIEKGANIEAKTRDGLTPLHCAARSGHEQVVDMLLERGAPISSKTKNGLAPLHMASQGDHVDAARILLYHRAPVDEVTVDYLTALHVAAHCGHVRVAKLLLDRKADPNARALNGFTPLHIACKKNRIKVVELLLKHGASIEATTESGLTPLHVASFMGCMNIVIYLIQHEANPDVPTVRGETPLHLAARANQADIIRILLRNGAQVDARAREQQTPLHIASRLGNVDIVMLLLQHGAAVDATTKDMYTALHIAAKEGQEEVASVLLEHGAALTATTKKGFTPLHLAAKYGKMKVARLLLQRDAPVDAQGKNGVTPLHVASHYDHQNVALLLLDKGASPHATAKNGHTPLHIAARKNQMDIATTLLEYGAKANAESKAGFTPLHLSSQEGHTDMSTLLIEHQADPNHKAKNGLTPLHLCAQEDRVNVATILVKNGAEVDAKTKAGYTPLHVACHFGQINMVRFLLQHGVDVNSATSAGYTPLHQAAQQGHVLIINLLLESRASPNAVTNQGQTALSIAQKLGYISVVETLKVVTETVITTTTTITTEEKYRVMAPETMQETFMSDSEDEGGEDTMLSDQPYRYLTVDEMKSLGDDSLPIDVTRDERGDSNRDSMAPPTAMEDSISPQHTKDYSHFTTSYAPDNVDIARHPVHVGKLQWKTFLVSFMVDARGGAMRGCRHSGVRVIVPPRKASMPMRITCRYLKKDKLAHPPPLMEGEALASRILELGPVAAKFLGPVIIEVPHFGSLRGKEREIVILRSDNGETWREHTLEASEEAIQDVLNESFGGEELTQLEDLNTNRITRILTTDFPQYFAIVSRVRQEVHAIGPEGGMVSSTVVPQVQAVFPQGALTKKIKVGLQAQPISAELVAKLLGNRVAVSPIVTVEPRRRKFHKPITLTIPVPQAANKGMINQYSGDAPTLRLLCSITGGTTRAQWEDVTGSTPLTFVNDCVSFTTTVSARFWLMDCRNIIEATKMATELYKEAIHVPFMAKFVVFAKRVDVLEARLRVFCMTDDKEDKTLEHQEHFTEVAKSRDVEVLEGKSQFVEFAGNLIPVTKSGDQLQLGFHAFKENRLPFTVRVKDPHADTVGRILFMREPKVAKGEPPQSPICILNIVLPDTITPETAPSEPDLLELEKKYSFLRDGSLSRAENIHRADLRLSDICNLLGTDWIPLANELGIAQDDIHLIKSEYPESVPQQAMVMLRLWMQQAGNKATGNTLEKSLRKINREDIVNRCIFNVELVTDDVEKAVAKVRLDQSGFDSLKEELGPSRDTSLRRNVSLDVTYDEQDIMKESESVEELVAAEKIVPSKEERIVREVEEHKAKDVDKEKDSGVIGEEVRKSIKDYEREEKKYVGEEKEYKEFEESLIKKDVSKPVKDEDDERKKSSVGAEEIEKTVVRKDETTPKISPIATIVAEDVSGDDRKRKAEMIAEITEELGRLDTSHKGSPLIAKEVVTSPKISKTPPPSPAEFREGTVSTKVTHEFPARSTVIGEEQTEYITPDGTTIRHTTITKTTTVVQGAEPSSEEAARLAESETWQSDDLDLSVHPEDLSSVQEWTERMQQKHTGGHERVAPEDAESRLLTDGDHKERIEETLKVEGLSYYSPAAGSKIPSISKSHPTSTLLDPQSSSDDHVDISMTKQTTETIYYSDMQPQLPPVDTEDVVEETIRSYSDRKKFWEQMTQGGKQVVDVSKDTVTKRVLKTSASQETPSSSSMVTPVPRPRSMVATSSIITKPGDSTSITSEIAESDTETGTQSDSTIRMRLFADAGQSTFTGSDISDQEVELDSGSTVKEKSSSVSLPTDSAVTLSSLQSKSLSRDSQAESSDSEAEYLAKRGGAPMAFDNRGFVGVEKIDIKESEEIEMTSDDTKDSTADKHTPLPSLPPSAAPRRIYERSASLPSEPSMPPVPSGFGGGVRAKKQFFEAQIKKEMAVEQLMTQPEEEPSPEHKALFHQDVGMSDQGQTKPIARFRRASEGHPVTQIPVGLAQMSVESVQESVFELKDDISIPETDSLPYDKDLCEALVEETSVKSIIGVFEKKITKPSVISPPCQEDDLSVHTEKVDFRSARHESDDTKSTEIDLSISQTSGGAEEIQEKGEVEKAEKYLSAPPSEEEMSKSVEDNVYTVSELDISEGPVSEIVEDAVTSLSTSRLISETDVSSETKIHADVEEHREKDEVQSDSDFSHLQEKGDAHESTRDIEFEESKDVISSRVAEMLQYKTEAITRPSDSLEVHVDKSEIEGTEKEREIEEDMEEFERVRVEEECKQGREKIDDEFEKTDEMKRSSEAYDFSLQEDEIDKVGMVVLEKESEEKDVYVLQQQLPDTVWEVPVQESSDSIAVEVTTDIPIEKQIIVEKEEDEEDLKSAQHSDDLREEKEKSITEARAIDISEEEAQIIAKEVVDEIEVKVAERSSFLQMIPEQETIELENIVEVEFVCPKPEVIETRKDVSDSHLLTSKVLKTDIQPVEHEEEITKEENEDNLVELEREEEVEVVKKTLAEVRESLEAAQEELLEQHKKRKEDEKYPREDDIASKKKSPSEFEFKVLGFQKMQNKYEDSSEEILHEDTGGITEYVVDGIPVKTSIQLEQKEILKATVKEVTEEERKLLGDQEDDKELIKEEHIKKFKDHTEGTVKSWESTAKEHSITGEGKAISMSSVEAEIVGEEEKKHSTILTEDQVHLPDSVSHETVSVERDVVEGNLQKNQREEARKEIEDESDGVKKTLIEEVKLSMSEVVSRKEETEEFSSETEKSKISEDLDEAVTVKSEETRRQTLVKETKEDRVIKECSKTMTISEQKVVQFDGSTSPSRDLSREFRKDYEDKKRQFKVEMEQSYSGMPFSGEVFEEGTSSTVFDKPFDSSVVIVKKTKGIGDSFEVSGMETFVSVDKSEGTTEPCQSDSFAIKKSNVFEEDPSALVLSEDEARSKESDIISAVKEAKVSDEELMGRTSSEDEAGGALKSPPRIEESSSSSSIAGKRVMGLISESEMVRLERPDGSGTTVVLRRSRPDKRSDAESSGSGGTFRGSERRSGADIEGWSSSGESHYQSFEQTSDSGRTFSRPCSSDFEGLIGIGSGVGIGHGTTGSSEYETALSASADYSGRSGGTTTSQDYRTAVSSLSSRESMKSLDSESSGHLASIEVSSEASETLVPSALELERDMEGVTGTSTLLEDEETATSTTLAPTAVECKVLEPYDTEIPVHIIKGESPGTSEHRKTAGLFQGHDSLSLEEDEGSGSGAEAPAAECPPSPFEIISESEVAEYPGEVSEPDDEEAELPEHEEAEDSEFNIGSAESRSRMKRSSEMTFHPEPRPIITDSPRSETPVSSAVNFSLASFSLDDGQTASSISITSSLGTVIEAQKHSGESDRMDASITSDQISGLTSSVVSEHLSIEESDTGIKSIIEEKVVFLEKGTMESGTSTGLPMEGTPSSVTITTSSVESELGVQSVCTQVTSEVQVMTYESSLTDLPQDIADAHSDAYPGEEGTDDTSFKEGKSEEFKGRNGPTEVDYTPEYDDFEENKKKTPRELGHRRKESTSFLPSMIPRPIKGRPKDSSAPSKVEGEKRKSEEVTEKEEPHEKHHDQGHIPVLQKTYPKKEQQQEIDDAFDLEVSHQVESKVGTHHDLREGGITSASTEGQRIRVASLDEPSFEIGEEEDAEVELKEIVGSRPQSTAESLISKSDSEGGHRPFSSEMGFSDDRPDSELTELLKQFSDGSGKDFLEDDEGRDEIEDPIERPKTPEPPLDYPDDLIEREEDEEVSSETQASVAELISGYTPSFKRDSISELVEQKVDKESISGLAKAFEKTPSRPTSPTSPTHPFSPEEGEMAEAEAAFQMVPRITPTLTVSHPDTILETEEEDKMMLDAQKKPIPKAVTVVAASDIPDITVTEHMTPKAKDIDEFTYHETSSKEAADAAEITDDVDIVGKTSTPQTPASVSSHASERSSENTDTDQGQEYVLGEETSADGDAIFEEPEEPEELTSSVASIVAVPVPGRLDGECTGGKFNADLHEVKEMPSSTSLPGSPTSDSFEMIEKSELHGTEAAAYMHEEDVSGDIREFMKEEPDNEEIFEEDDGIEDLLVSSPPPLPSRMTQIRYYPADQPLGSEYYQKEGYPQIPEGQPGQELMEGDSEGLYEYEMSFEHAGAPGGYGEEVETEYDREVEAGKKWIEMQFQGEMSSSSGIGIIPGMPGYGYEMDFERGPLEDIEERREEEEQNDGTASSSKVGSLGSCKESLSSTPEYDVLAGRKFFTRSGEHDDVSMSSLQEFERLEREIVASGSAGSVGSTGSDPRRTSLGSQDSLNGAVVGRKQTGSRNGQGDDISLSSLQEFERLESACIEAAKIESRARQEEALLSEIEEGHESQVSESESCETISETGGGNAEDVGGNNSDSDDYEKRMFEIDEIIRQAQSNVEKFEKEIPPHHDKHGIIGPIREASDTFSKAIATPRGISVASERMYDKMKTEEVKKSCEKSSAKEFNDGVQELDIDSSYSQILEEEEDIDDHHHLPHVAEVAAAAAAAVATATVAPHAHHAVASRTISAGSAHSTTTQFDVESLKERRIEDYDDEDSLMEGDAAMADDVMQGSTDSIEPKTVISDRVPIRHHDPLQTSTDSLDLRTTRSGDTMTTSADSIEFQAMATSGTMVASTDSLELDQQSMLKSFGAEECRDNMTTSVDSIEEEASHVIGMIQRPPVQDHSSSSGQEGDLSSSGREEDSGGAGVIPPMGGRPLRGSDPPEDPQRDLMVCSTDSLEPSSSTATHATYQYETDSVMSSSFTSGGSATMVSSTDTLDPEAMAAAAASLVSKGPQSPTYIASSALSSVLFDDSYQGESSSFIREGEISGSTDSAVGYTAEVKGGGTAYVTEVIEPVEEGEEGEASGFSHIIHRTVRLPPTIQHVTFTGPDAEEQLRSYVKQFAPGEEEHESEETDKHGNVHVTRVVQKRFVLGAEEFVSGVSDPILTKDMGDYSSLATSSKSDDTGHVRDSTKGASTSATKEDPLTMPVDFPQLTQKTEVTRMTVGHDIRTHSQTVPTHPSQDPPETLYPSRPGLTSSLAGETGDVEHMIQEDATATISTTMRGSEFYQMQDPEATSEYIAGQPTTQSRVVTTRTHTRTVMGEDGRPVTVTTTETEVGDVSGAEGVLDNNQLRESMQQIIDQFAAGEESKEGKGKEEKPE